MDVTIKRCRTSLNLLIFPCLMTSLWLRHCTPAAAFHAAGIRSNPLKVTWSPVQCGYLITSAHHVVSTGGQNNACQKLGPLNHEAALLSCLNYLLIAPILEMNIFAVGFRSLISSCFSLNLSANSKYQTHHPK